LSLMRLATREGVGDFTGDEGRISFNDGGARWLCRRTEWARRLTDRAGPKVTVYEICGNHVPPLGVSYFFGGKSMPTPDEFREQARSKRAEATRARRWAAEMTLDADRDRLHRHAAELVAEAAELDRQAIAPITQVQPPGYSTTQPVQQVQQQQQQQQQGPEGAGDDEKPKD
jgi:hypothetical protein